MALTLGACAVLPAQEPDRHRVILATASLGQRVTSAQLVYGAGRPMAMAILGRGGAGDFHREPVPSQALVNWIDAAGHAQARRVSLGEQVPRNMAGRTLKVEIDESRLKVFVDPPSGHHNLERRLVYGVSRRTRAAGVSACRRCDGPASLMTDVTPSHCTPHPPAQGRSAHAAAVPHAGCSGIKPDKLRHTC